MKRTKKWLAINYTARKWEEIVGEADTRAEAEDLWFTRQAHVRYYSKRNPNYIKHPLSDNIVWNEKDTTK